MNSELYDLYVVRTNGNSEWYSLSIWAIGDQAIYSGQWLDKRNEDQFTLQLHRDEVAALERSMSNGKVYKLCTQQPIDACRKVLRREWNDL